MFAHRGQNILRPLICQSCSTDYDVAGWGDCSENAYDNVQLKTGLMFSFLLFSLTNNKVLNLTKLKMTNSLFCSNLYCQAVFVFLSASMWVVVVVVGGGGLSPLSRFFFFLSHVYNCRQMASYSDLSIF